MIILSVLTGLILICILISKFSDDWSTTEETFGIVGCILVCLLVIIVILIPIERMDTNASIAMFEATRSALWTARCNDDISELESVSIQQQVIEQNKWLASEQYYNHTLFDIWIPDAIDKLEPIK